MAINMDIKCLEVEIDSMVAKILNFDHIDNLHPSFTLVTNCRYLLSIFDKVSISHIPCGKNC